MKKQEQITRYFNAEIIGSYLLVKEGLLSEEDINDIDIMTTQIEGIRRFLIDDGYKETQEYKPSASLVFRKEGFKDIHLCKSTEPLSVYKIEKLIYEKFKRGKKSDFVQIKKVMENKLKKIMIQHKVIV